MSDTKNNPISPKPESPVNGQEHPVDKKLQQGTADDIASWINRHNPNRDNVRGSSAVPVGQGVRTHKQHVSPPDPKEPQKPIPDIPHKIEGEEWGSEPTLKGQIDREEGIYWKFDRSEVKVFDLSQPNQAEEYSKLLTQSTKPDSNIFIIHDEARAFDQISNWKVFVKVQYILFRKLLLTKEEKS